MENITSNKILDRSEIECDSSNIYVKPSEVNGLGVFARKKFLPQDIIEVFPIVPLAFRTFYQGDSVLMDYSIVKYCECDECKRHGKAIFLRLGYGALYNHQDNFNADLSIDYANFLGRCVCHRPIEQDQEIFINYGPNFKFQNNGKVIV